jgi:hypothetical protein
MRRLFEAKTIRGMIRPRRIADRSQIVRAAASRLAHKNPA